VVGQDRDAGKEATSSMVDAVNGPSGRLSRRAVLRAAGVGVRSLAAAGFLAACGTSTSQLTAAVGTIKFVDNSNSSERARIQGYINTFQKSSGIPVSLVSIENYYTSNIEAMVSAGVAPDVLYVSRAEYDVLFPANKLADLQQYLQSSPQAGAAFFPIALAEWQHSGKQYAIPLGIRTQAVAFNTGLFAQNKLTIPPPAWTDPGWTISDFSSSAFSASQAGSASQDPNYGFYVDPVYLVWSAFVINAGGTVVNEQSRTIDVDQPPAIEALTVLQNVMLKPGVLPPNDLVSADGGIDLFANGNLAMTITDSSTIGSRQRQSHFLWDTGVLPSGAGGRFTTGTGAGYAIVVGSKSADKAWKLVDYLTGDAVQKQEARVGQWMPSRSAVANSPAFLPEMNNVDLSPQHARVFVDAISANRVKLQPALSNWPAVRDALEAGIQGLWTGAMSPAAAAAQMKKLAEPILKQG
jgi:ABC-type glycerol-3-phosphate transport system substrate-binding protein